MKDIIESIVISAIQCIPALVGFRILFDYTRIFLFSDK